MRFEINKPLDGREIYQVGNIIQSGDGLFMVCSLGINMPNYYLLDLANGRLINRTQSIEDMQEECFSVSDRLVTDVRLYKGDGRNV